MIELTIKDGVATVLFNKPEKMNCFTTSDMHDLIKVIRELNSREDVFIVIFRGAGKMFCSGFDITDFIPSIEKMDPFYEIFPAALFAIRNLQCSTLAALHGSAFGFGCGLAMSCDFRVAVKGTSMAIPTVRLGFTYPPNEVLSLTHKMGLPIMKDMLLAGRHLESERAYQLGIINQLVESTEEMEKEINRYIADIKKGAPLAMRLGKRSMHHLIRELVPREDESYQIYYQLFQGEDFYEGINSFIEKRQPHYKGM